MLKGLAAGCSTCIQTSCNVLKAVAVSFTEVGTRLGVPSAFDPWTNPLSRKGSSEVGHNWRSEGALERVAAASEHEDPPLISRGSRDVSAKSLRSRQPAPSPHARRHGHARPARGYPAQLHHVCAKLRGLSGPLAQDRHGRGRPALPDPPGRQRGAAAHHQQLGVGATLPVQCHAGSAGPVAAPRSGALRPEAAGRAERRGGRTAARSGAGSEVPGRARGGLRGRPARVRGGGRAGAAASCWPRAGCFPG